MGKRPQPRNIRVLPSRLKPGGGVSDLAYTGDGKRIFFLTGLVTGFTFFSVEAVCELIGPDGVLLFFHWLLSGL